MKTKFIFALLLLVITGTGVYLAIHQPQPPIITAPAAPPYDKYDFGRADAANIINVGTHPTLMISTFSSECLFHDRILRQQLAAEGWKLREHGFRSGKDMLPYTDGRLDVMIIGDIPAFIAMQKHNVGIFAVSRHGYNTLIAKRRLTPSELKGLRVGYTAGTVNHFTLERALKSAGLSFDDIVSVPLSPDEMESAFQNHRVDAVVPYEPYTTMIIENIAGSTAIFRSDSYAYVAVDLDFASRHPTLSKAILAAIVRAAHWGKQDEDNLRTALLWIRQASIRFTGKSAFEVNTKWINMLRRDTIATPSFPMLPLDFSDEQSLLRQQFDFLKQSGILPAGAEWKKISDRVNTRILPEIIQDGKTWQIDRFDYAQDKLNHEQEGSS